MVALWTAHAQLSRFYLYPTWLRIKPSMRIQRSEGLGYKGQRAWGRGYLLDLMSLVVVFVVFLHVLQAFSNMVSNQQGECVLNSGECM